jgi:hypothetical protein
MYATSHGNLQPAVCCCLILYFPGCAAVVLIIPLPTLLVSTTALRPRWSGQNVTGGGADAGLDALSLSTHLTACWIEILTVQHGAASP